MTSPRLDLPVDDFGEFTVVALLGEGGSGTVYRARWGHREVALKVMRAELPISERDRFLSEARLLMEITHPGVVKVLAAGTLPDERPYLAMEILPGETLASRLARTALPVGDAVTLFTQLADAVAAMHARGLLHRDLKPENVMLVSDGEREHAVLLDFGIARAMEAGAVAPTQTGIVRGTPAYMAPERFFGQPATIATDVYELAVTLFAMIAGRLPWADCIDPEVRLNPARLADAATVPEALDAEVARALSTRAGNRPASAQALRDAVLSATGQGAPSARLTAPVAPLALARTVATPRPVARTPSAPVQATMPAWTGGGQASVTTGNAAGERRATADTPARRRRWPWAVALAIGVGGAVAVPLVLSRGEHRAATTGPSRVVDPSDPWDRPSRTATTAEPSTPEPSTPTAVTAPFTASERAAARDELAAAALHHADDNRSVMGLAVAELRADPSLGPALAAAGRSATLATMTAMVVGRCRFDLLGRARWLIFAASPDGSFDVTARGDWTRAEVEQCLMTGREGALRRIAAAGVEGPEPITLVPLDGADGTDVQPVGWLDDHTFIATTREHVDAAFIAARLAGTRGAGGKELEAGLAALDRRATAWVVASRDGFDAVIETPALRGAAMTARIALGGEGADFAVKLRYADQATATAAHTFADRQLAGLAGDGVLGLALPGFAVERDGVVVGIRGRLPTSLMGSLRDQLIAALP